MMLRRRVPALALSCVVLTFLACSSDPESSTTLPVESLAQAVSASGPGQLVPTPHGGWVFDYAKDGDWLSGDFDGDGYTDLAEAISFGGKVAIHVDKGRPDVAKQVIAPTATTYAVFPATAPHRFVAGDFDGDGRADVVAVHDDGAGRSVLDVMRSNGSGFTRTATVVGAWPYAASEKWLAGDFDNDGKSDLASARNDGGLVSIGVFLSTGGSFAQVAPWQTRQGGWGDDMAWVVGDFDNDHRADLATVWNEGGYNSIAMRRSTGAAFTAENWDTKEGGWLPSTRWVSGDFDGDGTCDIAGAWNDAGSVSIGVYPSHFTGFKGTWQYTVRKGAFPAGAPWLSGDFNGDGGIDVVAIDTSALPGSSRVPFDMYANQASGSAFIRLGGPAREVATMPDGSLWALSPQADANGNFGLLRRKTFPIPGDDYWAPAGTGGVHIEGGPGGPYVIRANGDVVTGSGALLDKRARDIGVGPDGTIWLVSDELYVWGGYRVYRRRPGAAWEFMSAAGVAVDAGPGGSAWLVNSVHQIYSFTTGWQQITGEAWDVTVSPEGTVYVVGTTPRAHGYIMWRRDGSTWTELPGVGVNFANAGAGGEMYATTLAGVTYALDRAVPVRTFIGPYDPTLAACRSFPEAGATWSGTWSGWSTFGNPPGTFCSYTWSSATPTLSAIAALGREQGGIPFADGYTLTADPSCSAPGCTRAKGALVRTASPPSLVCAPETPPALGVPVPASMARTSHDGATKCTVCKSPMVGSAVTGVIYVQLPATAQRDAAGNVTLFQQSIVDGVTTYAQVGTLNAPSSSVVVAPASIPDGPLWAKTTDTSFTQQ